MSTYEPSQMLALIHNRRLARAKLAEVKMVNIGGRPVIVPTPNSAAQKRKDSIKVVLAFLAIYIVWGSTYLAIRYAVETIPPLVTAGIRHTIAGSILLVWAMARGYRPRREHWLAGSIVGALFFLVGHGTLHWAEQQVASGLAALLIATEPMFILVLAWLSGQQKISRLSALGLAFGVAGVAILTGVELSSKGASLIGMLAVLLGSLAWAAGVAEIEVDTATGSIKVLNYVSAHDVGRIINPLSLKQQIEGGAIMGIGQALTETLMRDKATGVPLNPNLLDYKLLSIKDVPNVDVVMVEKPKNYGVYGAHGIGEPPISSAASAMIAAVYNAVGVWVEDIPLTRARVLAALKNAS